MKSSTRIHRAVIETLENRRLLSFTAPVSYSVASTPQSVATGDFNGDGRSDVVTANSGSNNVSVLLSNSNGTLGAAQQFAAGTAPRAVAVGDVNNDGKRDIITANGAWNLSVLLGNGNGTFQSPMTVTLPTQNPPGYDPTTLAVAVGDLNADGKLDLAVSSAVTFDVPYVDPYGYPGSRPEAFVYVNVLVGNGNGTFASANTYPDNGPANSIAVADMNNDSKLDVLSASGQVWLGNGNGTLQQPPKSVGYSSRGFALGDFDMDQKRDVVSAGIGLSFMKGNGDGTTQNPVVIPLVGEAQSVVAGDVNGDGKLDLVANTFTATFASYGYYGGSGPTTTLYTKVLLGSGNGTFSPGISSTTASFAGLSSAAANSSALGDFNADGKPDLVATNPANNKIFVQLNQPGWIVPGTLSIRGPTAVTEGNSGTVNTVFTVTLDSPPSPAANVTVDYAVTDGTATLAGGDFVANSGTLTFTPGQTSKTITVQVKGDRVGEPDEYFNVKLTNPINADTTVAQAYGYIHDDEPRVSITGGQVTEGNSGTTPLTFTATLSAASDVPVTVNYKTVDGSAKGATDFVPVTSSITFAPGQTTKTFTVQVNGDLVPENTETFYVNLTGATSAFIVDNGQATGTILDTDPDPTISISNVTRAEGNAGTEREFEFIISVSKPSGKAILVDFATADGTATSSGSNQDYYAYSSDMSISPGQMFASIYVYVIGDNRSESDETFFVNLTNASGATIADNQGVGTILNDETRGKKWIGPKTGGNWSTASNWSPSGVPVATSLVNIDGASVTVSASVSVDELSLVNYATLTVAPGGGKVLRARALSMDYYSTTLNLNDNNLIVDYTAAAGNISPLGAWNFYGYTSIVGMVHYGSLGNGTGIVTTRPDALAGRTTLAVGEAAQILGITGSQNALFSGQTVDATTVLVKYTYRGDANFDGTLDIDDYTAIDYGISAGLNGWSNGDFNYDGKVNIDDYLIIDSKYRSQGAALVGAASADEVVLAARPALVTPPVMDWDAVEKRDSATIDLLA